jgi:hypothetical protein
MQIENVVQAVASVLAIVIAVASYRKSTRVAHDIHHQESLRLQYQEFNELSALRLTYPEVSHILELPEQYQLTLQRVRRRVSELPLHERLDAIIRERAVALRVFELYEQTLFQYEHAKECGNKKGEEFLAAVIEYLSGRLLLNPRLAYLWECNGNGGLQTYFEETTNIHYDEKIRPHLLEVDSIGLENCCDPQDFQTGDVPESRV